MECRRFLWWVPPATGGRAGRVKPAGPFLGCHMLRVLAIAALCLPASAAPQLKDRPPPPEWFDRLCGQSWEQRPWVEMNRGCARLTGDQVIALGKRLTFLMHRRFPGQEFVTMWERESGCEMPTNPEQIAGTLWVILYQEHRGFWSNYASPPPPSTWDP